MQILDTNARLELARKLATDVLAPLKQIFVGKDEVVDLLGICLVGSENLFILGPPGTAKSAIVQELGRRIRGNVFDYLLTRFTEPNELFGPFDIRKLREGELVTNTEGMLPEASLVFLDELLNANSALLNALLMVLNERVFRRGRETRKLSLLMTIGASNRLPDDEALAALFDRFLLRVRSDNVPDEMLNDVLQSGWRLESKSSPRDHGAEVLTVEELREVQALLPEVDVSPIQQAYLDTIRALRKAGIAVSDRRAVKLQRVVAASGLLCGRLMADLSDLWVLRYIWDTEEQREVIAGIVDGVLKRKEPQPDVPVHPRASGSKPDPEAIALEVARIAERLHTAPDAATQSVLRDQLSAAASRAQWIVSNEARRHLEAEIGSLWKRFSTTS